METSQCPICGKEYTGDKCTVCGYEDNSGIFGDDRDKMVEHTDKANDKKDEGVTRKRKLDEAIALLNNAANTSPQPDWAMDVISSSLAVLNMPMNIESLSKIELSDDEKKIINLCHTVLASSDSGDQMLAQPPEVYIRLGNVFFLQGDRETSMDYYSKAILKNPSSEHALFNHAYALFMLKRYGDARKALDKILSKYPENQRAIHLKELVQQLDAVG